MKKLHLIIWASLVFFPLDVFPQDAKTNSSPEVVELKYDALSKQFLITKKSLRAYPETSYKFKVVDYNATLYTPIVKAVATRHKSVIPDPVKSFVAFVDFSRDLDFKFNAPNPNLISLGGDDAIASVLRSAELELDAIKIAKDTTSLKVQAVEKALSANKAANKKVLEKSTKELDDESYLLKSKLSELNYKEEAILSKIAYLKRLPVPPAHPIFSTINQFNTEYNYLRLTEKSLGDLSRDLSTLVSDNNGSKVRSEAARAEIIRIYPGLQDDLTALEKRFSLSLNTCAALKESISLQLSNGTTPVDSRTQEAIDQALIAWEYVSTHKEALTNLMRSFTKLFPANTFMLTDTYVHKYDYAMVSVKLVNNLNNKDTVLRQNISIYSKGGWDIDFSVGLLYNSIYKRSWYVDTVGAGAIRSERTFRADVAWAALINFSHRSGFKTRTGLSIGAGTSLVDGGMRYLLGIHQYYGKRDIVGWSAGASFGKRNFLPKLVSDNGTDPRAQLPAGLTAITPYERWTIGIYAGVFYNFARL